MKAMDQMRVVARVAETVSPGSARAHRVASRSSHGAPSLTASSHRARAWPDDHAMVQFLRDGVAGGRAARERALPGFGDVVDAAQRRACPGTGGAPCSSAPRGPTVSTPGDAHEREADAAADKVMRMADPAQIAAAPLSVQRRCATCDDDHASARTNDTGSTGPANGHRSASPLVPGAGEPLPAPERAFFEPRFGVDFSDVRIHSGAKASSSARALGATAYTLGSNVVFGSGQWAPGTDAGRRLLAHELAHVVQQSGGAPALALSPVQGELQRMCAPAPCPVVALPVDALFPVWRQAELCIQDTYINTHPGNTVSRNKEWVSLVGKTPSERAALRCLKAEGFTGKSGMAAGEPDLWDFSNATMYEITTPSGAGFRIGKLAAEIALANKIVSKMDCGGTTFGPGDWVPPGPCYAMGSDLYMRVENIGGVLVYHALKDATKEAAAAALLAALAAMAKSGLLQRLAGALGQRLGGKLVPGYAAASVVAAVVLIASGRAEAKIGFGGDDPLVALFKSLEQKGTPVPPEVRHMIESDPALKKLVEDAMTGKKDPSKAEQELNDKLLKIINDNKDQFTADDLKVLLAVTQSAGNRLPNETVTVDTIKKAIEDKKAGKTGGTGSAAPAAGTGSAAPATGTGSAAPAAGTGSTAGAPAASVQARLASATPTQRQIFDAMFSQTGKGPSITDDDVSQFFATVPPDLSAGDASKVIAQLQAYKGGSVADALAGLAASVAALRMPATGAVAQDVKAAGSAGAIPAPPDASGAATDLAAELAAIVRRSDYSQFADGDRRFTMTDDEWKAGAALMKKPPLTKTLLLVQNGRHLAAVITLKVISVQPNGLTAQIVGSSIVVDADQHQVLAANALVSTSTFTLIGAGAKP